MGESFTTKLRTVGDGMAGLRGSTLIRILPAALAALLLFLVFAASEFRGLTDPEAMDYAQVAARVADGRGFSTGCIRPVDWWYLERAGRKPSVDKHPDIRHGPIFPLLLAAVFKALPGRAFVASEARVYPPEWLAIIPVCQIFAVAAGLSLYFLGRRLFGARVAVVAAVCYLVSEAVFDDSISGLPCSLVAFLVTAALHAAVTAVQRVNDNEPLRRRLPPVIACSLLCAAAFLTRYAAVAALPAVFMFFGLAGKRNGWRAGVLCAAIFGVAVAPWLIRNLAVSGGLLGIAPRGALEETAVFERNDFDRSLAPSMDRARLVPAVKEKFVFGFARLCGHNLRALGSGLLVSFFLVSFFHRFMRDDVHAFRWCVAAALILMTALGALYGGNTARLLNAFLPVVVLYGAAFYFLALERMRLEPIELETFVTSLVVLLCALPLGARLIARGGSFPYPPYFPPFVSHVSNMLGKDETLCSDIPWATAWYGKRTSVLLPASLDDFYKINDSLVRIKGLYLTTETGDRPYLSALVNGTDRSWLPILNGRVPPDFPLKEAIFLPPGGRDQLFLTDREHLPRSVAGDAPAEVRYR